MSDHATHHWVLIEDDDLDLILSFDPEDVSRDARPLIEAYRKWANSVRDIVEDGLETA